jgi:hypothetical protein
MAEQMKTQAIRTGRNVMAMLILLLSAVAAPPSVYGLSYPPAMLYHRAERNENAVRGDVVYLFHSGTSDVRSTVHIGDTLAVYRVTPRCEVIPVGVIRVVSFEGETYLKGEVLEGEIRPDDVAKKERVSCLVISAGMCKK